MLILKTIKHDQKTNRAMTKHSKTSPEKIQRIERTEGNTINFFRTRVFGSLQIKNEDENQNRKKNFRRKRLLNFFSQSINSKINFKHCDSKKQKLIEERTNKGRVRQHKIIFQKSIFLLISLKLRVIKSKRRVRQHKIIGNN